MSDATNEERPGFFSIDQNSHPLWDAVPKIAALARNGRGGMHFVEDVDVAFTRQGAEAGDSELALVRERVYRGGVSDWGAALFYTEFLGRLPADVRRLEPFTGWSTAALSRRLEVSVDELYDRYAVSDNWQLVGASYAEDPRYHRVIGDIRVAEAAPFLHRLVDHARDDVLRAFPAPESRARTDAWFAAESARVDDLLQRFADARLVDLYCAWMTAHAPPGVQVAVTSDLLTGEHPELPHHELLDMFVRDYDTSAGLYNAAIEEGAVDVNPLNTRNGELPFFVIFRRDGRMFRSSVQLDGTRLVAGGESWPVAREGGGLALPWQAMRDSGVLCIVGKALLLVLHARFRPQGAPLALPHMGSAYMPAAYAFERRLRREGVLDRETFPVLRVRFNFLERLSACQATVCLPEYLRAGFTESEMKACELAEELRRRTAEARAELEAAKSKAGRQAILERIAPAAAARKTALENRRRELARDPETRPRASAIWEEVKELDRDLLGRLVDRLVLQFAIADLAYYDSRGALQPWSIAAGGEEFYEYLLEAAEIVPETCGTDASQP